MPVRRRPPRSVRSRSRPGVAMTTSAPRVDLGLLLAVGNPADEEGDAEPVIDAVFGEGFLDLGGEFARRLEDQRAGHSRLGASALEQRQHRKGEGGRLAGAGLRNAEHVAGLEDVRNALRLDWIRRGIARRFDGVEHLLAQAEFVESHSFSHRADLKTCVRAGFVEASWAALCAAAALCAWIAAEVSLQRSSLQRSRCAMRLAKPKFFGLGGSAHSGFLRKVNKSEPGAATASRSARKSAGRTTTFGRPAQGRGRRRTGVDAARPSAQVMEIGVEIEGFEGARFPLAPRQQGEGGVRARGMSRFTDPIPHPDLLPRKRGEGDACRAPQSCGCGSWGASRVRRLCRRRRAGVVPASAMR